MQLMVDNIRYWDKVGKSEKSAPAHVSGLGTIQSGLLGEVRDIIDTARQQASR